MGCWDILVIILLIIVIGSIIGSYIYKKKHNIPTGECACCHTRMRKAIKEALKEVRKN